MPLLLLCRPTVIESDHLFLPKWIRAPLYLGEGARYFAALESHRRSNGNVELVISAIDNTLWEDIWRIEIDTQNAPGNALILFSLLEDRGLAVLASESSTNTFSKNHTTTIIASASEYSDPDDSSDAERLGMKVPFLPSLRREIIAYLGDQIAFRPDGKVALKIAHMRSHRAMFRDLQSGSRFILNRMGDTVTNGCIRLTPRARQHLERSIGSKEMQYAPSVDTKDRLIRVIFNGYRNPRQYDVQLISSIEMEYQFHNIYNILYQNNANIIRSNVRPCPHKKAMNSVKTNPSTSAYIDELYYRTFDITFEFVGDIDDIGQLRLIDKAIGDVSRTSSGGIAVTKRSWSEQE